MSQLKKIIAGVLILVVLAIVAIVVIQLLRDDDANLATQAPLIPTATVSTDSPTTETSRPVTDATTINLPDGVLHFVIDPNLSSAKYVVREKLAVLPVSSDAVGETSDVFGDLFLTADGLFADQESTFQVDLRTLRSDESRRDNFLRNNTFQTSQFPFAEFVIDRVSAFPTDYIEGTEVELTIEGHLTIHGVTNQVVFELKARRQGDVLSAIADTDFNLTDFGMTPPNLRIAVSEDGVHIQIVLVANLVN